MSEIIKIVDTPGWDAGARSIASFLFDGDLEFAVGQAVGIVCGLTTADQSASYHDIQHAFCIENSTARIIERGVLKTTAVRVAPDAIYRIERRDGGVRYLIDEVAHYVSQTASEGEAFADCSLYLFGDEILGLTVTDRGGARLYAELPALIARGSELDENTLFAALPALEAFGEEDTGDSLYAELPALIARGSELDENTLFAELPALEAFGDEETSGIVSLPALAAFGNEHWLAPDYNALSAELTALVAFGWESTFEENSLYAELPALIARGSELDEDTLYAGLPALTLVEMVVERQNLFVLRAPPWRLELRQWGPDSNRMVGDLLVPLPRLSARLADGPYVRGTLALPLPNLTAYAGAQGQLSLPLPQATGRLQSAFGLLAQLELPLPQLTASFQVCAQVQAHLLLPLPRLTAYTGAHAQFSLPLPQFAATLQQRPVAQAHLLLPLPSLTAFVTGGGAATAHLLLPLPRLTAYAGAQGQLVLPLPQFVAVHPQAVADSPPEVWLINVRTGAITTALWGRFDRLATAHGRLYGLREGQLYTLDANAPLSMTLRFASQDFGTGLLKSCTEVYLQCRDAQGVTLTVIPDETTHYTYTPPLRSSPSYGSQKVSVGKGLRFHTLGLIVQNREGGPLDLGGMELLIVPTSRRPR